MHRCALTVTLALGSALTVTLPARAQAGQVVLHPSPGWPPITQDAAPVSRQPTTLPFGTRVRVTDLKTGRSVVVIITDRGPFNRGRVLDLCTRAARALGMIDRGVIYVRAEEFCRAQMWWLVRDKPGA